MKHISPVLLSVYLVLTGISCRQQGAQTNASPSRPAAEERMAVTRWQSAGSALDWQRRRLSYEDHTYELIVLRNDDAAVSWGIHYSPEPKRLADWQQQLGAQAILNGSFFTETFAPTGSFRSEGIPHGGKPYTGATVGTVAITNGRLRLVEDLSKLNNDDHFQSFPLLLARGGKVQVPTESDKIARRTIIGQNMAGQSFVILFDTTPISLYDAARILATLDDIGLDWALNLDGGPSSGLLAGSGTDRLQILPAVELPIVLSLRPRS